MRQHLHRSVRQVACKTVDVELHSRKPGAMPKKHALNFAVDGETACDVFHSVRRHRRLGVLRIGIGKSGGGMVFGFHGGQTRARVLLRLQVRLRPRDRGLGGIEIRRGRAGGARRAGGGYRLSGVAHFLHGSAGTSGKADDTDKDGKKAQHRVL